MRTHFNKALLLQEKTINCPLSFNLFFISWTPGWYQGDTGDNHNIFMALRHTLTIPVYAISLLALLPAYLVLFFYYSTFIEFSK